MTVVLPYKPNYQSQEEGVELRIHYSKAKSGIVKLTRNSDVKHLAMGFIKTYGLNKQMHSHLVEVIQAKKSEVFG